MRRFACIVIIAALAVGPSLAQEKTRPVLYVSCTADKASYGPSEKVDLTISLENLGQSDVYIFRTLEWGWAGIGFTLSDATGQIVRPRKLTYPLPPPPVHDKSQLVGLHPGYFFGAHLPFDLAHYDLRPGSYFLGVSYQSNYREKDGFGLPLLTFADGKFESKKVHILVR